MLHSRCSFIASAIFSMGCVIFPNNVFAQNHNIVEQVLKGEWTCPISYEQNDWGAVKSVQIWSFSEKQMTEKLIMSISINNPPDSGTIVSNEINDYTLQSNQIKVKVNSAKVTLSTPPKNEPLIEMFKHLFSGTKEGAEERVKSKAESLLSIDYIDELNLRTYQIDIQGKRTNEISCNRIKKP